MTSRRQPFLKRKDICFCYPRIIQEENDGCVYASNAAAVNYLAGRQIWTEESLLNKCKQSGLESAGPGVIEIAHAPVVNEIDCKFNAKNESLLTKQTVRQWVEQENKIIILSRPYQNDSQKWHMLTLIAWDKDHFITWDSAGKMSSIFEEEIESEIPYQNGIALEPHPDHHAFIYWKKL